MIGVCFRWWSLIFCSSSWSVGNCIQLINLEPWHPSWRSLMAQPNRLIGSFSKQRLIFLPHLMDFAELFRDLNTRSKMVTNTPGMSANHLQQWNELTDEFGEVICKPKATDLQVVRGEKQPTSSDALRFYSYHERFINSLENGEC